MMGSAGRLALASMLSLLVVTPTSVGAAGKAAPIERFQQVDDRLYRGAQPDASGFRYLRELGIKTVINLRMEADGIKLQEREMVEALGMRYINLPVEDGNFFTRSRRIPEEVIKTFFTIIDAAESGPVFVHCHRGADRTGAIISFYRIARHGWDSVRAYTEARRVGMRSWYRGLKAQIEEFARTANRYAASSSSS